MDPIKFEGQNVTFAENQEEYRPLPAHRDPDGVVTTCWEFTPEELAELNKTGKLWIQQLTFKQALQPINMFLDVKFINLEELNDGPY